MEPIRLNTTADLDNYDVAVKDILHAIRPDWNVEKDVEVKVPCQGGYINRQLKCHHIPSDEIILIRINGKETKELLDRELECKNMVYYNSYGLSQPVYCIFDNGIAYSYFRGETLSMNEWEIPHYEELIACELAKLHTTPLAEHMLSSRVVYIVNAERWLAELPETFEDDPEFGQRFQDYVGMNKKGLTKEWEIIAELLRLYGGEEVCSHNDTGLGNILYSSETDSIRFVDFEFSGRGYSMLDIIGYFQYWTGTEDDVLLAYKENQSRWLQRYLYYVKKFKGLPVDVTAEEVEDYLERVNIVTMCNFFYVSLYTMATSTRYKVGLDYIRPILREYRQHKNLFLKDQESKPSFPVKLEEFSKTFN